MCFFCVCATDGIVILIILIDQEVQRPPTSVASVAYQQNKKTIITILTLYVIIFFQYIHRIPVIQYYIYSYKNAVNCIVFSE